MKRTKLHTGETIFVNTLNMTKEYIGINNEMHSLVGNYIDVHRLSHHYNQAIVVRHPLSKENYTIHCADVSLEPILKNTRKIIKVERAIKGKFDVNTLSL